MAAGSKRYSAELKMDAVDMVAQLVNGDTEWAAMCKTSNLLGVGTAETVRQWVRKVPIGSASGEPAGEVIRKLRQENAELKRANGILKAASAFFCGRNRPATPVIVDFIDTHQGHRVSADGLVWGVSFERTVSSHFPHESFDATSRNIKDIAAQHIQVFREPNARASGCLCRSMCIASMTRASDRIRALRARLTWS